MRLDGWKSIATHLGIRVGTAQGFCEIGLPIRKTLDGSVWTTTEALWLWHQGVVGIAEQLRKRHIRPRGVALH